MFYLKIKFVLEVLERPITPRKETHRNVAVEVDAFVVVMAQLYTNFGANHAATFEMTAFDVPEKLLQISTLDVLTRTFAAVGRMKQEIFSKVLRYDMQRQRSSTQRATP